MKQITTSSYGLRIISDSIPDLDTVTIGAWVNIGSMYEPEEINGISHLLEHMVFKGTKKRTALQIAEEIENVGGYFNAATSKETTCFYIKVLKEDLPLAVDVLSDVLINSTFEPSEFEREKSVVLQEIKQSIDTPDDIIGDYYAEKAFPNQPLGRPILGTVEKVTAISRETLHNYLKTNYTPERMVVAASGNLNHDELVKLVDKAFSDLKPNNSLIAPIPNYVGGFDYREKDIEQANIIVGFKGVSVLDNEYYTSHVLSTILGGGMSSRLFQEIREKRGLVYSVYSYISSGLNIGQFCVYAGTGEEETKELLPVLCDELLKVQENITEKELTRAKSQLKAGILMALEHTSSRCEQDASQMLMFNRLITKEEIIEKINSVNIDRLQKLARQIFTSKPTIAALGPIKNVMSYDELCNRLGTK
ncbi:MAG: insulinase family protein [Alphaproteobacteria bacterium]|nr:insulinase family protein [Alphaproteobacteria bacterium]